MLRRNVIGWVLAGVNAAAFVLFLAFRPSATGGYPSMIQRSARMVAIHVEPGHPALFAGRVISPSDYQTAPFLAALILNFPALIVTNQVLVSTIGLAPASLSQPALSWIHASAYLLFSTFQWLAIGYLAHRGLKRLRGGAPEATDRTSGAP